MRSFFPRYKGVIFGVVIVSLLILAVLTKIGFTPASKLPTKSIIPTQKPIDSCDSLATDRDRLICKEEKRKKQISIQPIPTTQSDVSCVSFPIIPGEISCQEAEKIALNKYPGTITAVSKSDLQDRKAWFVEVSLSSSSEKARLAIDRKTKEIFINVIKK